MPSHNISTPQGADSPSLAIAQARALGDQSSTGQRFDRAQPDEAERARLAATLGALLRSMRAERRLSTRALAVRSTVARSTITRLETGHRRPRPGILAALAYGLDHENPEPLAEALQAAAGESLRPDTPQADRRRARRLGRARREVKALRIAVGRKAGHARVAARELILTDLRRLHIPPARATYTAAQLERETAALDRVSAVMDARARLELQADSLMATLAWPYHPLWKEPLERDLEA